MSTPYIIGLRIQYPSGTNLANVNVTVRLESTNESYSKITNSSGEATFNLGNTKEFPSGWRIEDIFSITILYTGYEAYSSHTIVSGEGGYTATIVLTAVSVAPSLVIFRPQDFLTYFGLVAKDTDAENGIDMQKLVLIGSGVEQQIENDTNFTFDNNNGSYYSKTEYIDTHEKEDIYFVSKLPVRSVTNLYTTQNDEETTPDYTNNTTEWDSLTEGSHYFIDKGDSGSGRIQITNSSYQPITRKNGLYIVYTYGRTSIPDDIKMLAIIETGLRMSGSTFIRDKIKKISDVDIGDLESFNAYRNKIINRYKFDGLTSINT